VVGYAIMRGTQKVTLAQIPPKTGVLLRPCSNIIKEATLLAGKPGGNSDLYALENLVPRVNNVK